MRDRSMLSLITPRQTGVIFLTISTCMLLSVVTPLCVFVSNLLGVLQTLKKRHTS
jgi:hypothetical protein